MDEIQQIEEVLRRLWPGIDMVRNGQRLYGNNGRVRLRVDMGVTTHAVVTLDSVELSRARWGPVGTAEDTLTQQRDHARAVVDALASALGLEVSDG